MKNILNRPNAYLYDKVQELHRLLKPVLSPPAHHALQQGGSSASPSLSTKDLDAVFVLLVGDIFGSQAVIAAKYGPGWNLTGLSRSRHYRDYHAVLNFLGSSGLLMQCIHALAADPNCVYEYPAARLPFRTRPKVPSAVAVASPLIGYASADEEQFVPLSPFEYYLYHFTALVNQSHEWYQASAVDSDSLYPVLFEEYLSTYLPVGGAFFKFFHMYDSSVYTRSPTTSPQSGQPQHLQGKTSLLRSDLSFGSPAGNVTLDQSYHQQPQPQFSPPFSHPFGHHKGTSSSFHRPPEMWRACIIVDTVTKFWLISWSEEEEKVCELIGSPPAAIGSPKAARPPRIPSSDVVKMVRMFIKHVHYFLNSFAIVDETADDARESLRTNLFGEFFNGLHRFLSFLFDHWPLDASFRLVLETWLSFIQPWRYKDPAAGERDNAVGVFSSGGVWDGFIAKNLRFYDDIFQKLMLKFCRLDLSSNRNAFMLFRVAKVFSQPGLVQTLRNVVAAKGAVELQTTSPDERMHGLNRPTEISSPYHHNIFGEDFRFLMGQLVTKAIEAKHAALEKKANLMAESAEQRPSSRMAQEELNWLLNLVWSLFTSEPVPCSESEECDKTIQNLEFSVDRLTELFRLDLDVVDITSKLAAASASASRRGCAQLFDDVKTPMTPQRRWELLNRTVRYSPGLSSYWGNPDETPLRSDEFHSLARLLHKVSRFLSEQLRVDEVYMEPGLAGIVARQVCRPPATYRVKNEADPCCSYRHEKLPARLVLRPLASHATIVYLVTFMFFGWILGQRFFFKALLMLFTMWAVRLAYVAATKNDTSLKVKKNDREKNKGASDVTDSGLISSHDESGLS